MFFNLTAGMRWFSSQVRWRRQVKNGVGLSSYKGVQYGN
jgi:hypothetical protein